MEISTSTAALSLNYNAAEKVSRSLYETMRWDLVWCEELEIGGRIGDDVALGARVLLHGGGRVAEPIETDAEDTEQPEHVREQVAVLHAVLNTNNNENLTGSLAVGIAELLNIKRNIILQNTKMRNINICNTMDINWSNFAVNSIIDF